MRPAAEYVVYPWWPENGNRWLHPQDVALARRVIPSWRVFRVLGRDGPYRVLGYGCWRLRVRPTLWIPVPGDGLQVGDLVEIRSQLGKRRPGIARISQMLWNPRRKCIEYHLWRRDLLSQSRHCASELIQLEELSVARRRRADVRLRLV